MALEKGDKVIVRCKGDKWNGETGKVIAKCSLGLTVMFCEKEKKGLPRSARMYDPQNLRRA